LQPGGEIATCLQGQGGLVAALTARAAAEITEQGCLAVLHGGEGVGVPIHLQSAADALVDERPALGDVLQSGLVDASSSAGFAEDTAAQSELFQGLLALAALPQQIGQAGVIRPAIVAGKPLGGQLLMDLESSGEVALALQGTGF